MTERTLINGQDLFGTFGIFVTQDGYNDLIEYPGLKPVPINDWPEEDGIEVDLTQPILTAKESSISFATMAGHSTSAFLQALSAQVYHDFTFNELGQNFRLRMASQAEFNADIPNIEVFTLRFINDFPLDGYTYQAPAPSAIGTPGQYYLDGRDLLDYGLIVLRGSGTEVKKAPPVKKNLEIDINAIPGLIYDSHSVVYQHKEVAIHCLIRAVTPAEFWRNYKALLYDLTRPGYRTLASYHTAQANTCYYKGAAVSHFHLEPTVWCQFTLRLEFINFRP